MIQDTDGLFQLLRLTLRLLNAGAKFVALFAPPKDIVLLFLQPPFLRLDILACSAQLWTFGDAFKVDQFRAARLTHSMLPRTSKFHISPFPVSTSEIGGCIVAHLVSLAPFQPSELASDVVHLEFPRMTVCAKRQSPDAEHLQQRTFDDYPFAPNPVWCRLDSPNTISLTCGGRKANVLAEAALPA